jgi:outer membrane receptor protein involved in Fe transport
MVPAHAQTSGSHSSEPAPQGSTVGGPASPPTSPEPTSNAASPPSANGVGDIIVTAQKREQRLNSVGMAIQAATATALTTRGIVDAKDLVKIIPGFTATQTAFATPVYTLRGIGLYDAGYMASPSVAIYVDQIPRNYPVMSGGVGLDLERVEVLKGPQGTLFGQSATGGAINYIAAKPTDHFEAGLDGSYERFGKADLSGFVSGPITDNLKARLAVRSVTGGAWQYRQSDPSQKNGKTDTFNARLLVDWQPTDRLKISVGITGMRDKSDNQAAQLISNKLNISGTPAQIAAAGGTPSSENPYAVINPTLFGQLTTSGSPNYDPGFVAHQNLVLGRLNPTVIDAATIAAQNGARLYLGQSSPSGIRAAEWAAGWSNASNNSYYQGTLRADFDVSDEITLSSISAFAKQKISRFFSEDATLARALADHSFGHVTTFNEEVHLAGNSDRLHWIVGTTYDHASDSDNTYYNLPDDSLSDPVGIGPFPNSFAHIDEKTNNYAIFGNAEYKVNSALSFQGGIRYTWNNLSSNNCGSDSDEFGNPTPAGMDLLNQAFDILGGGTSGLGPIIGPGQCIVLDGTTRGIGLGNPLITPLHQTLDERNLSWRGGVTYKFDHGTLLYATVSQGYKGGIFGGIAASTAVQYRPAKQEKVIAYEFGVKTPLFDRKVQVNTGFFYYDYSDKQVRARVNDPIFGLLEKLLNVPKSYIWGVEAEVQAQPFRGLSINASGTYLKSKVTSDFAFVNGQNVYNQEGYTGNFKGSQLPFTPKLSGVFDAQYSWNLSERLVPFLGGSVLYHGKNYATFHTPVLLANDYVLPAYTTVDVHLGIGSADGEWSANLFGRNIFNKRYLTTIFAGTDTTFRYTGLPATYGVAVRFRFK